MAVYIPSKQIYGTSYDELGLQVGHVRLPDESLWDFRRRLLAEARDPIDASEGSALKKIGRRLGVQSVSVLNIELVLSAGLPVAEDPVVEITSTHIRFYRDYENGTLTKELEFNSDGKFLVDIETEMTGNAYFTVTLLDSDYEFYRSDRLLVGTNLHYVYKYFLKPSFVNKLPHMNIRLASFEATEVFEEEQVSVSAMAEEGHYYLDNYNGTIFSYLTAARSCSYQYAKFPLLVEYSTARSYLLNDSDISWKHRSLDTGSGEPHKLNYEGISVLNSVLAGHPIHWGE